MAAAYDFIVQSWSVKGADGIVRQQRVQGSCKTLGTLFGDVTVRRIQYRSKHKGVQSIHRMDATLNISGDKFSDGVRRRAVEESSKVSFHEAAHSVRSTTASRIGVKQCEQLTVEVSQDFDDFYAQRDYGNAEADSIPEDALLVMSSDGKGIVMHPDSPRESTRKAQEQHHQERKKAKRLSPGQKQGRKRMATVASVYQVSPYVRTPEQVLKSGENEAQNEHDMPRPKVLNKRVWARVELTAGEVISDMFDEAQKRDPEGERKRVVLVDGNEHQLSVIEAEAKMRKFSVTVVVDIIHVIEYLWKAAYAFYSPGSEEAGSWVEQRIKMLLEGKVSMVAAGMRQSASKLGLNPLERAPVDTCAKYLLKYRSYLRYDEYLQNGFPIATGIIEGACRHLVADRMDITGARWGLERAEAVLKIRALRASNDFDDYWDYHKRREQQRNHLSRYAADSLPIAA